MADVRLENVTKKYGSLVALNNISFECRDGEFFTLLGPSGAGKTTMLELIAGIKKVADGRIFIGNRMVNDLAPQERDVAMAFENYALYPHFTVYENIVFPLRSPKRTKELSATEERQRAEETASVLGIQELLGRNPQHLSGGQRQRVSLARAMVRRPQVYLLDEPIAHLDAKLKISTRATLKQLANKVGITIIYVTHDYREALALSDRILVLRKGTVEQIATPEALYASPSSDFVARLVGDPPTNLLDGEIVSENGRVFFKADSDFRFPIRQDLVSLMERTVVEEEGKRTVRIGIRPAHVRISENKLSDSSFQLPVYVVEHEAESSLLTFELSNGFFQIKTDHRVSHKVAEKVWLELDQDHLLFFRKTMEITK